MTMFILPLSLKFDYLYDDGHVGMEVPKTSKRGYLVKPQFPKIRMKYVISL